MPEDRWALLVGASEYENFNKLTYAAFDASEFKQSLVGHLNFDPRRIVLLADSDEGAPDFRPTRHHVFHALGLLSNAHSRFYAEREIDPIGEDDLFVFYFSGHGLRSEDGEQFLLPVEASDEDVTQTGVPLEDVVKGIERLPCRHKILFIDACRADLEGVAGAKSIGNEEGFGRADIDRPGLALFYSCDPKQRSFEVDELQHGTFTHALLQAVTHERINTLAELDDYLTSRVPKLNAKHRKPLQQPFCVLNPSDMRAIALFQLPLVVGESDNDELIAMANDLFSQGKIDWDWYEKLESVWDEEHVYNLELKKAILRRFHAGAMTFEQFERRWLRSEKHIPSVRAPQPTVSVGAPTGGRSSSEADVSKEDLQEDHE